MDTRPGLASILWIRWVIDLLTGTVTGGLIAGTAGICIDMLAEVCTTAMVLAVIILEDGATLAYGIEVRAGIVMDTDGCMIVGVKRIIDF